MQASLLYQTACFLGEGSMWHEKRQQLFWVDIEEKKLHSIDPLTKVHQAWLLSSRTGTIVPDLQGRIIMGMHGHVNRFDPDTGESEMLLRIESHLPGNRSNDGKCDPAGRFWLGTMALDERPHAGNLYCITPDLAVTTKLEHTSISNGIVWTKDRKTMYYIDSPTGTIQAFDYNDETGEIRSRETAVTIPADMGSPDGMAIDENDQLWVAQWGGSGVYHWDPLSGNLISKIEVPAPHVSSCAFGGKDLDHLYITTARKDLSAGDLEQYPLSGSVFVAKPGVKGTAPNAFAG